MNFILQYQLFIFLGIIIIQSLVIAFVLSDLTKKIKKLFGGSTNKEQTVEENAIRRLTKLETELETLEPRIRMTEAIAKKSIQKVGFTRFNPFPGTGGDNSFILNLLDQENNGILISSLYTRDGVRIYGKAVEKGEAKHHMSEEEKKILEDTVNKSAY